MLALVTATKNSIETVADALTSAAPVRESIKHYLIDGQSTDGTWEYLQRFADETKNSVLIPQTGAGLYEALNEAIGAALRDHDVSHIGFLHSDDRLIPDAYREYVGHIQREIADVFYSDITYHDAQGRCVRVWKSGTYSPFKLKTGWMPPHTGVIVTNRVFKEFGFYDPCYGTAADYEWLVRIMLADSLTLSYYPMQTVSMKVGGASSSCIAARIRANAMDAKVWENKSKKRATLIRVCKPLRKLSQFLLPTN